MNLNDLKKLMPEIFERVKRDVRQVLGQHRAGLRLGLGDYGISNGGFMGGYHNYPGTDIVMNKSPLRIILESQPYEVVWAYTYHILLHEYIHSLGELDEQRCKYYTRKISEQIFIEADHPAIVLVKNGIGAFIPNLRFINVPSDGIPEDVPIELVHGFDQESQSYFS